MASQIQGLLHGCADVAIGSGCDIIQTVGGTPAVCIAGKFVRVPAGLEAKMPECYKTGYLAYDGNSECSALFHQIVGKVHFVDSDADTVGFAGDLRRCVDDTAAVPAPRGRSEDKQAVGQLIHCFVIHAILLVNGLIDSDFPNIYVLKST